MCTVSVIPLFDGPGRPIGFRLVTSRDEQRTRQPALAPAWRPLGGEPGAPTALYPQDPDAGGTWVGAGDSGFVACLLNRAPRNPLLAPAPETRISRGLLTLATLRAGSITGAIEAAQSLDLERLLPFRIMLIESDPTGFRSAMLVWEGTTLDVRTSGAPLLCEASSGLGDHLVQERLALFASMVDASSPTPEAQDAFHQHRWEDRLQYSVLMERAEARTVSITTVDVVHEPAVSVRMAYHPIPLKPAERVEPVVVTCSDWTPLASRA